MGCDGFGFWGPVIATPPTEPPMLATTPSCWTPSMRLHPLLNVLLLLLAAMPLHAAQLSESKPEVRVGIVLFDGVQIIDFAGPYEVFGTAGFGVITISHDGKPVTTAMGLNVTPDAAFADAPAFDVLLVPGGDLGKAKVDAKLLDFIRSRSATAKNVLSVCTGAEILANTGLLDGRRATTFHNALDRLATEHPAIEVVGDQRWVDNGKLITTAGLSTGLDGALHVVSRLRGQDKARSVALHMEYDWRPDHGFVRGRMADRLMPSLRGVKWPQDIAVEQPYSLGDERQWRMRVTMRTATSSEGIMNLIANDLDNDSQWRRDRSATALVWRHADIAKPTRLSVTSHPGASAQEFELELELQREAVDPPRLR